MLAFTICSGDRPAALGTLVAAAHGFVFGFLRSHLAVSAEVRVSSQLVLPAANRRTVREQTSIQFAAFRNPRLAIAEIWTSQFFELANVDAKTY